MIFKTVIGILLFGTMSSYSFDVSKDTIIFNTQEFAPFNFSQNGKITGPVKDVIDIVCATMNINCTFKSLPWPRSQKEVRTGEAHALFSIGKNIARKKWLHYSLPVVKTEYGFFTNTKSLSSITTLNELSDKTVGVYGPSNTYSTLQSIQNDVPTMDIDLRHDSESGFKKLSRNRVDAVFSNRFVGEFIINKNALSNLQYSYKFKELRYYIGFNKSFFDVRFINEFNEHILKLYKNQTIQLILKKYNMENAYIDMGDLSEMSLAQTLITLEYSSY